MTEFTKGEWRTVDSTGQSMGVWVGDSVCITEINYNFWDPKYQAELKANANLIAAAPDMYEFIDSLIGHGLVYGGDIDKAMELLAKARGE